MDILTQDEQVARVKAHMRAQELYKRLMERSITPSEMNEWMEFPLPMRLDVMRMGWRNEVPESERHLANYAN